MNIMIYLAIINLAYCNNNAIFYDCSNLISCKTDHDCKVNFAGRCIDGKCYLMKTAGAYCSTGFECASYFYYGPEACSAAYCSSMSKCQLTLKAYTGREEYKCCRSIPLGGVCRSQDLPPSLNPSFSGGCDRRSTCQNDYGHYRCLPKRPFLWKILVWSTILASLMINIAYVFKRNQLATNSLPPPSISTFYFISLGNLAILFSFVFGTLTLIAPLALTGSIARLWLKVFKKRIKCSFFIDIILTLYLVGGAFFIIYFAQAYENEYNSCEIIQLLFQCISFIKILSVVLVSVYLCMKFLEANVILRPSRYLQQQPIERMATLTQKPLLTPYDALFRVDWYYFYPDGYAYLFLLPLCYGYVAGYFSVATIICLKILRVILKTYKEMDSELSNHWRVFWIVSAVGILSAMSQFYWTLKAFRRISNRLIEIMINIMSTLLTCLVGCIVFDELEEFAFSRLLFWSLALVAILVGSSGVVLRKEEP